MLREPGASVPMRSPFVRGSSRRLTPSTTGSMTESSSNAASSGASPPAVGDAVGLATADSSGVADGLALPDGVGVPDPTAAPRSWSRVRSTSARIPARTASTTTPAISGQGFGCVRRSVGGGPPAGRYGCSVNTPLHPRVEGAGHRNVPKEPRDPLMQSLGPRTPPGQPLRYGPGL